MRKAAAEQKSNQQAMYVRKVRAASFMGAFLSFFVGACLAPFVWAALAWGVHWLGWKLFGGASPGIFHGLLDFVAAPSLGVGLIWLLYYIVGYIVALWRLSPREEAQIAHSMATFSSWQIGREEEDDEWADPLGLAPPASSRKGKPVLSRAIPGELKHQLVERCYEEYRKALLRYDPPPVDLRTPKTFEYGKGVHLGWNKKDMLPILPEELLVPERIHLLLGPLAQHLAWYNTNDPDRIVLRDYPDFVPWPWLLLPTGNCLWLPVMVKHRLEVPAYLDEPEEQREQVHQALKFTCYLGQGPALEHLYRRFHAELERRGLEDRSFPTLSERIGYLEVLNRQEREQMRQLGLTPEVPPLVKGEVPLQQTSPWMVYTSRQ
jgi:hypothetical protein